MADDNTVVTSPPPDVDVGEPGDVGMQTVTKTGRPAKRFSTPTGVYKTLQAMEQCDSTDADRRSVIQGMLDGNPPYLESELKQACLGDMTNVNWLGLRGVLESRLSIVDQMIGSDTRLVEVVPRTVSSSPNNLYDIGEVIADEFSTAIHDWAGMVPLLEAVVRDRDAHGLGVAIFPDANDWRPIPLPRGALRVLADAKIDIDENEVIAVEATMTAGDMFVVLENETKGWDLEAVRRYLVATFVDKENTASAAGEQGTSLLEAWQARIRDGTWDDSAQFEVLRIVHVFAKEVSVDGGVTHIILPAAQNGDAYWLYEKEKAYDKLSEAVWWMPANSSADGRLRSLRGIASYLAPLMHFDNMFLCHTLDIAWRSSGLILQSQTNADPAALRFVEFGPYTVLPPELKPAVNSMPAGGLDNLVRTREMFHGVAQNNALGLRYTPGNQPERAVGGQRSAREVDAESQALALADKHAARAGFKAVAALFQQMFHRMAKSGERTPGVARELAKQFKEACIARMVTKEQWKQLDDIFVVRLSRELEMGGPAAFVSAMNTIMALRPGMDEEGSTRVMRDLLSPIVGRRHIDKYRPIINRENLSTSAASMAKLENNSLMSGMTAMAGRDQHHKVHLGVHLQIVAQIVQGAQQGQIGDVGQSAKTLRQALMHAVEHIRMYGEDPAFVDEAKAMMKALEPAVQLLKKLDTAAEAVLKVQQEQAQAQAEAQAQQADAAAQASSLNGVRLSPELMVKKYEIDKKDVISRMEQESLNGMRAEKTKVQNRIALAHAQFQIKVKALQAKADAAVKAAGGVPAGSGQELEASSLDMEPEIDMNLDEAEEAAPMDQMQV